jgi:hypothetical protein
MKERPHSCILRPLFRTCSQILDGEHGNAWRRALYPDYKSGRNMYRPFPTIGHRRNRHPVHIDPFVNMPMLGDLFRLLNIPVSCNSSQTVPLLFLT